MKRSQKITFGVASILLCLISMLITSCNLTFSNLPTTTPTPSRAADQKYRWPVSGTDISTFDPALASDADSINAVNMVFTGLVQFDDSLKVQPQLAQSYDKTPDGLTYTFHLHASLKFSDGTRLTSKDVAYSIDRALSPAIFNQSGVSLTYLGLIKDASARTQGKISSLINDSILTPDTNTVVLKLSKATAYFLDALAYPTSYVVEKSIIDRWGSKWTDHLADNGGQGGAGPFKVKSYVHSRGIALVPNPNYYDRKPQLKEVDQIFYKSVETSYMDYQAGQLDVTSIPLSEYAQASRSKELNKTPQLAIDYMAMNYLVKPFDNIKIRQAFELALNKDAIVHAVWKDTYTATCHIVPRGMYGYNPGLQCPYGAPTSGDRAKAKQLFTEGLQEEGMTLATLPPIKITYASSSVYLTNEITTASQMWQETLGVTVGTQVMDFVSFLNAVNQTTGNAHGLQMWVSSWIADYPDPQDWLTLQFGDNQPYNAINYGNNSSSDAQQQKQNQQAMDNADVMTDVNARERAYNQAEQQLVNDVAWLPLYQRLGLSLRKSYVVGFKKANAFAITPPNDWANIYIAVH